MRECSPSMYRAADTAAATVIPTAISSRRVSASFPCPPKYLGNGKGLPARILKEQPIALPVRPFQIAFKPLKPGRRVEPVSPWDGQCPSRFSVGLQNFARQVMPPSGEIRVFDLYPLGGWKNFGEGKNRGRSFFKARHASLEWFRALFLPFFRIRSRGFPLLLQRREEGSFGRRWSNCPKL